MKWLLRGIAKRKELLAEIGPRPKYVLSPELLQGIVNSTKDTVSTLLQIKQKRSAMSQQDNKPFLWTDELVAKFFMDTYKGGFYDLNKHVSDFKASHSSSEKVEKDWEVVAVWQGQGSFIQVDKNRKVRYAHFSDCTLEDALQNRSYTMYSVRRISDNVVFTIGDEVKTNAEEIKDWWGKITGFWLSGGGDMHICYNSHHYDISTFEKKAPIPEEKPSVKPPIGIIPEWLWKEKRLEEIRAAVKRYIDANEPVPINWIVEEYCLREWVENRKNQDKQPGDEA